MFIKTWFYK